MIIKFKKSWPSITRDAISLLIVFLFIFTGVSSEVEAAGGDAEILFYMQSLGNLPEFCKYKIAETEFRAEFADLNDPRRINWPLRFENLLNQWKRRLGNLNWTYVHHYCFGIREINEYKQMNNYQRKKFKESQLKGALKQFEFVRRSKAGPNFPLKSELYNYEYYIYMELGEYQKAQWAFKQSVKNRRIK